MKNYIFPFILVALFSMMSHFLNAQVITGDTSVCIESYRIYTFPTQSGNTYQWNVSGGSIVDISTDKDSIEIIWTTNVEGTVSLIESDDVSINSYSLVVDLHGLPLPFVELSFSSGCQKGERVYSRVKTRVAVVSSHDCFKICELMPITYYANGDNGSGFEWQIAGDYTTIEWTEDSVTVIWNSVGEGTVALTETTTDGCENTVSYCMEIIPVPDASFDILHPSAASQTLYTCKGQEVQFQNTSTVEDMTYTLAWFVEDVWAGEGEILSYEFEDAGTYEIMLIINNACNCKDTAYASIEVDLSPAASFECIGVVCEGDEVTYTTDAICNPYNYTVDGSTNYSSNGNEITVTWNDVPETGYGQIILDGSTCPNICDQPSIINVPVIQQNATIMGPNPVCSGGTQVINYSVPLWAGTAYTWEIVSQSGAAYLQNYNTNQVGLFINQSTSNVVLAVSYYNELLQCGGADTISILIKEPLEMISPNVICLGEEAIFSAEPSGASSSYNWYINGVIQQSSLSANFAHTFLAEGQYQVSVSNADFCESIARQIIVTEVPPPPLAIEGEDAVCLGFFYNYVATTTSDDYYIEWEITDGITTITDEGNSIVHRWGDTPPYIVSCRQIHTTNPGCASTPISINVYPVDAPAVNIEGDDVVC
ncbi:MAG: hypothetical protein ACPG4Z_07610, partial [Chitinophagales bacterium]